MSSKLKKKKTFFDFSEKEGLYIIICIPIQYYIGQSSHVTRRINAHKTALRRGCHSNLSMQEDFNFYSETAFEFKKLLFGLGASKKERENFETFILLTLCCEQRYNFYSNWRKKEEFINSFLGKSHTLEARMLQGFDKVGKPSKFANQKQTNEVKLLISSLNSGQSSKERRKPLYINSIFYESISEASEKTGYARRLIRERCHSKEERFENYKWKR